MNSSLSLNSPLQSIFWSKNKALTTDLLVVLGSVVLLAFSAHLIIPMQPVPITFQSATVILVGMTLGARLSFYSLTAYLLAGFLGLPVFAPTGTENSLLIGPTLGYLIGFLPAAVLSGYLAQRGFAKSILGSFIAACLGALIIFSLGVTVLSTLTGWQNAIAFGLMPFIFIEPIKLLAASLFIPRCWKHRA